MIEYTLLAIVFGLAFLAAYYCDMQQTRRLNAIAEALARIEDKLNQGENREEPAVPTTSA